MKRKTNKWSNRVQLLIALLIGLYIITMANAIALAILLSKPHIVYLK